jgi:hypothetical protein
MIDQDRNFPQADRQWSGWPTDVLRSAIAVIATTRCEWAVRRTAVAPVTDRTSAPTKDVLAQRLRPSECFLECPPGRNQLEA